VPLRSNGASIIEAPHNNRGLVLTYIGGPWFVIRFSLGELKGAVQNYPAVELKRGGLSSDLQDEDFAMTIE
jgi:hypothetical protein